ncbi:MAG TPA: hybrid sensor histidine kinase/response regulator [Hydrogenophaga sp.]|uniref:hybrid sensor histidine kinase/response regulator n=1 Tax=Hydrogenophaga sp. TaxID=1904254 RepID=UPI002CA2F731|nr:hybrid sensor histidine kinase/response regulator [Hydrogenophaga sp.]HMN93450.1 hybrid sensor histidine kinase/response regulator [Hydrogenophaga sp.]HMP11461.1 hybrid sensor histidine kinase/response regulator [Hydrogenophaga sp.]
MTADTVAAGAPVLPSAVLMVDDEPLACKWFERLFCDEFLVWTAGGVDEAMELLASRGDEVAVLLTDFRMPGRDGLELLGLVRHRHEHVARLLVSAYADKSVAVAAVNEGRVEHILEKPLDEQEARQVIRRALAGSMRRVQDRRLAATRAAALRETLGFLAHEVTTPLATVRGYLGALSERHLDDAEDAAARFAQEQPGQVLGMIEAARRRADYAQSLVTGFLHHARDACLGEDVPGPSALALVRDVIRTFPFDPGEAEHVSLQAETDFLLPGRRDLLQLVVSTLIKNALQARRGTGRIPVLVRLTIAHRTIAPGGAVTPCLTVSDNGHGIDPTLLSRLGREPVSTRRDSGGSGMGLLFCHRVMQSLAGDMVIESEPGRGTTVSLFFPATEDRPVPAAQVQEP